MNASSSSVSSTKAPRRKCTECGHFPLVRLDTFGADDVHGAPTVDAVAPGRPWGLIAPEASLLVIVTSWLGNLFFGAAKTARLRAKSNAPAPNCCRAVPTP
jgi:hypothetical protein